MVVFIIIFVSFMCTLYTHTHVMVMVDDSSCVVKRGKIICTN